jgi:hypothetical protein
MNTVHSEDASRHHGIVRTVRVHGGTVAWQAAMLQGCWRTSDFTSSTLTRPLVKALGSGRK